MSLRSRKYLGEEDESQNRRYKRRGAIINWKYVINGKAAGQWLKEGSAKLNRNSENNLVYLRIEGVKRVFRIHNTLVKGIRSEFWDESSMARKA